jgi:hypothetical protein
MNTVLPVSADLIDGFLTSPLLPNFVSAELTNLSSATSSEYGCYVSLSDSES